MPQSDLCTTSRSKSRKRARTPNPREESRPKKRLHRSQHSDFSPSMTVDSPQSAASAASIGQHYGLGDEGALENLFATHPHSFTTVPHPTYRKGPMSHRGSSASIMRYIFRMISCQRYRDHNEFESLYLGLKRIRLRPTLRRSLLQALRPQRAPSSSQPCG
ncbi:hypothetical protein ACCO45_009874 [Purpureocillium lilacinum]|uniref:Uncharacterized protein n=1 Tax=Purpureocillium lilacinum TaxID=33203 RepID=A0ACC4DHN9_PURLI